MSEVITPILPTIIDGRDTSGPSNEKPRNPDKGQLYWDTDTNTMLIFDGSDWAVLNCKGKCKDCDKCETPSVPPAPAPEPAPVEEPAPNPPATPTISDMPTS